jgi:hypothetical protein
VIVRPLVVMSVMRKAFVPSIVIHFPILSITLRWCSGQARSNVCILAVRIGQQVLRVAEAAELGGDGGNQALGAVLVRAALPEHGAAEAVGRQVARLLLHAGHGVVADELARAGVVAVRGAGHVVVGLGGAGARQRLVVPHPVLPRAGANAAVGLAQAAGRLEGAAVDGHAQQDLGRRDAGRNVRLDGNVGGEGRRDGIVGIGVQVGLVSGRRVPRSGIVCRVSRAAASLDVLP